VIHKAASSFWDCYNKLPLNTRNLADKNFQILRDNHTHPSLQFKKVGKLWSVRVGAHYRALAAPIDGGFLWVWVGTHANYDKLLA
jgi:hypothetical protein